jgi:hypothetical protein
LHRFAKIAAACTLLVLMSGAAVTSSNDQPRQALLHSIHTAVGVVGAALLAGLALWLLRTGPARAGWTTLAMVAVEAGSASLGTLHASMAAIVFAQCCAIVLFTSPAWKREPDFVQDYGWPSLRFLSSAAAVFVLVQVGFGAGVRHSAVGIMPHLLGALVVVIFITIVGAFVSHQFPAHASLKPMAVALMVITGIQAFLGMTAFLLRLMQAAGTLLFLAVSVLHVATGSLTLGVSVMLALEIRRSVRARERV